MRHFSDFNRSLSTKTSSLFCFLYFFFSIYLLILYICVPQSAAVLAVTNVSQYMDDTAIRRMVLPKLKMVYETNPNDLKIVLNILACLEIILHRLEKQQIIEDVLPLLWIVNQTDPEVIARTAGTPDGILNRPPDSHCHRWLCIPSKTIVLNTNIPTPHMYKIGQEIHLKIFFYCYYFTRKTMNTTVIGQHLEGLHVIFLI